MGRAAKESPALDRTWISVRRSSLLGTSSPSRVGSGGGGSSFRLSSSQEIFVAIARSLISMLAVLADLVLRFAPGEHCLLDPENLPGSSSTRGGRSSGGFFKLPGRYSARLIVMAIERELLPLRLPYSRYFASCSRRSSTAPLIREYVPGSSSTRGGRVSSSRGLVMISRTSLPHAIAAAVPAFLVGTVGTVESARISAGLAVPTCPFQGRNRSELGVALRGQSLESASRRSALAKSLNFPSP